MKNEVKNGSAFRTKTAPCPTRRHFGLTEAPHFTLHFTFISSFGLNFFIVRDLGLMQIRFSGRKSGGAVVTDCPHHSGLPQKDVSVTPSPAVCEEIGLSGLYHGVAAMCMRNY